MMKNYSTKIMRRNRGKIVYLIGLTCSLAVMSMPLWLTGFDAFGMFAIWVFAAFSALLFTLAFRKF